MNPEDLYIKSLLERIVEVCRGHFQWLSHYAEKRSGCFVANYWVTGKVMTTDSDSWQPEDSITDTALQILKAEECLKFYHDENTRKSAASTIENICVPWVENLGKQDKRACSAWPHTQQEDTNIFRLDDHVWIWKALRVVEDLGFWPRKVGQNEMRTSQEIQQRILRRFTMENEIVRKRMLAVTRSSRETRFLFHARDTALFYGYDCNFFLQETSFHELWENTIRAQALHSYNQDISWDNTLRYALAILMGTRNYRINQQSPRDLVKWSVQSIFNAISLSGFCAGELNEITKKPVIFERAKDRDSYFHSSFEIPFILLTNAGRINAIYNQEEPKVEESQSPNSQPHFLRIDVKDYLSEQRGRPKRQQESHEEEVRGIEPMKKTTLFNRLFDSATIVEIDEEWLYNYPTFLSNENEITYNDLMKTLNDLKEREWDLDVNGHEMIAAAKIRLENGIEAFDVYMNRGRVEDTPKKWKGRKQIRDDQIHTFNGLYSNDILLQLLRMPRTADIAKKRFIWLLNANGETALICYLTSIDVERPAISQFFDHHWNKDDYFFDDTTAITNTWETELHLSFYHLTSYREKSAGHDGRILSENIFPGREAQVVMTSMGFRFFGDFFDRYWTCYLIENGRVLRPNEDWENGYAERDIKLPSPYSQTDRVWKQRKVLELYFFEYILSTLVKCTREILGEIKRELGVRQGALSSTTLSSEDYFFSSIQWQQFQNTLEAMEEKLESVQLEVSKWETREKDRGREKPRWTRNYERKYGGAIKKLTRSTNKQIRELHSVYTSVKSLKETLVRSQEQIRADLSLRGAEDIRFFTYVTVVFLPLGFASSIFSMNGNPGSDLVLSLVICAIIALLITVFALVNAKTLGYIVSRFFHLIDRYSLTKMKHSILVLEGKERNERKYDEEAKGETQDGSPEVKGDIRQNPDGAHREHYRPNSLRRQNSWRFWFLVAYILLEFPARRVAIAYDVLKCPGFSWVGLVHVVLGVLFVVPCVLSGLMQIVVLNVLDMLKLLFGTYI